MARVTCWLVGLCTPFCICTVALGDHFRSHIYIYYCMLANPSWFGMVKFITIAEDRFALICNEYRQRAFPSEHQQFSSDGILRIPGRRLTNCVKVGTFSRFQAELSSLHSATWPFTASPVQPRGLWRRLLSSAPRTERRTEALALLKNWSSSSHGFPWCIMVCYKLAILRVLKMAKHHCITKYHTSLKTSDTASASPSSATHQVMVFWSSAVRMMPRWLSKGSCT